MMSTPSTTSTIALTTAARALPDHHEDDDSDHEHSWFKPSQLLTRSVWRRWLLRVWFYKARLVDPQWYVQFVKGENGIANLYLLTWFALNIAITLLSKALFSHFHFPYPMLLTAIHLGATGIGSQVASYSGYYPAASLTQEQLKELVVFSIVFTLNIWLSNYALFVVSVSVHQVFRTTIPLFTMLLSLALYGEVYPWRMLPSVLTVIIGVAATVWGDIEITFWGGVVVACGCAFSSLKGLMSQKAQIGAKGLHTFDLLRACCPMAVAELLICACFNGELVQFISDEIPALTSKTVWILASQGLLAFTLNFVSFKCSALKNPLTMNIAGNVKQVITPFFAIWLLGGQLTGPLIFGLVFTFIGAMWYGNEAGLRKVRVEGATAHEDAVETPESARLVANAKRITSVELGPTTILPVEDHPVAAEATTVASIDSKTTDLEESLKESPSAAVGNMEVV